MPERSCKGFPHLTTICIIFVCLSFNSCGTSSRDQIQETKPEAVKPAPNVEEIPTAEQRLGIEIVSLRLTMRGTLLDFRYRVKDPEKASPLFDRQIKPYLVDQASGAKLEVPVSKLGALRQTSRNPLVDRTYFMLFGNGNGLVQAGSKVTVVIGDYRIENLTVE